MPTMSPIDASIAALRAQVAAIESGGRRSGRQRLPFGVDAIDRRLALGGLAVAALHEVAAQRASLNDDAAATLFTAGIAARAVPDKGNMLWVLSRRDLFAPALAQVGLTPDRLIYAECRNDEEVLAVMEDGLRSGALAFVVGEVGRVAMASSRRLQLAAEQGGTTALMLRRWRRSGDDPLALPSAAVTRWRIGCVPSGALPFEGIGCPRWQVELVRQRSGAPHLWLMEGSDAEGCLALPAEPAHRPAAPDRGDAVRAA